MVKRRQPYTASSFQERLNTELFGRTLHHYRCVGSTNDELMRLAAAGAPEGTLVVADEQAAGRGRAGRVWLAPPGSGLLLPSCFGRVAWLPIERSS